MRYPVVIAIMLILLGSGCSKDPAAPAQTTPPPADHTANWDLTTADGLLEALVDCWVRRDAADYAGLLYDGVQPAADDETYREFLFNCSEPPPANPPENYQESYDFEQELAVTDRMFSGDPGTVIDGVNMPGSETIEISLDSIPDLHWAEPVGESVDGDAFPAGTICNSLQLSLHLILKESWDVIGVEINGFQVNSEVRLHLIPVITTEGPEYRLWKWREFYSYDRNFPGRSGREPGDTLEADLGLIKYLYCF